MILRARYAALGLIGTGLLYAEGVLKNAVIEVGLVVPILWVMVSSRFSDREKGIMVAMAAGCLTLVLCDLLVRPIAPGYLHYAPHNMYSRNLPALPMLGRWDADVRFRGMAYGDLAAMSGNSALREPREIVFQTDPWGFRNERRPERIDIVVLGDSFAAGLGTTQERIFSTLLERISGRSVYNLSYPGGPYDEFLNWVIESPALQLTANADLIWILYTGNDLQDAGGDIWDSATLPWNSAIGALAVQYRTFRNRSPLNQLMERIRARFHAPAADDVLVRGLPDGRPVLFAGWQEMWSRRSADEITTLVNFTRLVKTMEAMARAATERGVRLSIFIMPTKGQVYPWVVHQQQPSIEPGGSSGFTRAVLAACETLGLRCFDTAPFLVREAATLYQSSGELLWWRDDTHLGDAGHHAVVKFLLEHIVPTVP